MLSSRIDDYRGLDGPFGIRALSVGILEHQHRVGPAAPKGVGYKHDTSHRRGSSLSLRVVRIAQTAISDWRSLKMGGQSGSPAMPHRCRHRHLVADIVIRAFVEGG